MSDPSATIAKAEQLLRVGQWAQARALAAAFADAGALAVRARAVLANAALQLGEHAEAATQFRWLLQALPGHAGVRAALSMALNNLGSAALQAGDAGTAEAHYREAVAVDARNALAWYNLGGRAQAGNRFDAAAQAYARSCELDPTRLDARLQWALCERLRGAPQAARAALAGLPATLPAELAAKVGGEWELLGESAAAQAAFAQALAGGDGALALRIAKAQVEAGDCAGARASAALAGARGQGESLALRAALLGALALPLVPEDEDAIDAARTGFAEGVAALAREWPADRVARSGARLDDLAHSHYALAYQGRDDRALAGAFGDWYGAAAAALVAARMPDPAPRRVALVSARWHLGTIAAYFGPWIGALRAGGWEVDLLHLGGVVDEVTHALAAAADAFHHLPGPLEDAVARLRERAPALILYPEVGLSPRLYPLAALRLAPRQWVAWGHPVSTGLTTIDTFLSCGEMEPIDAAAQYREPLRTLPGLGTSYARPARARALSREALGLPQAAKLYLVPHAAVKIAPAMDALLAGIVAGDPRARLVLFEDPSPALGARLRARLRRCFDAHGVDAGAHLHWLPRASPERFREVLAAGDVMLDTPGFSGGNTSLDALAQGLPLVALPGASMRSRQSAAMLALAGVPELAAADAAGYIGCALRVAGDRSHAQDLRARIDAGTPRLFDDPAPLAALLASVGAP